MLLQVTHETRYHYQPVVETAQHMAYLQPRTHLAQNLMSHALTIAPQPAQRRSAIDIYGNDRCFFSLQSPHEELTVVARSLVSTHSVDRPISTITCAQQRNQFLYHAGGGFDPANEFVFVSPFVPRHPDFSAYAQPSFTPDRPVMDAAQDLMRRIHSDFTYQSQSTEINTPALEALAQRKGVCQDFAHIMLACLRAAGLPARYVSGYLLTTPPPGSAKLVGSDASHAWVSVYLSDLPEGARWCDFDPTNNRWGWHSPGEDYITVATGRDFGDLSPLRGVIHGGARHTLQVAVTVESINGDNTPTPMRTTQSQTQSQGVNTDQGGYQYQRQSTIK